MEFVTNINDQMDMANAGCFRSDEPLNTQFLLLFGDREKPCPKFYGKIDDKKKVYHALKEHIHHEVQAKWGHLQCHCQQPPKMRWSKTAKNMNKVFLTCGAPTYPAESRCQYFQWMHTPSYPLPSDPIPEWLLKGRQYKRKPMKSINKESQEWMQQAEQNIQTWKQTHWMNEFAKTMKKQEEERKAKRKASLPSTFERSPQIAEMYKKQDQLKEFHSIANKEFAACMNRKKDVPSEAEQTEKQEKATGVWSNASNTEFVNGP